MSRPIVFRSVAQLELDEAALWYEERLPGLGLEFIDAVESLCSTIAEDPQRFPFVRNQVRRAVVLRFPYTIHYLLEADRIVVLAVFHAKRDPSRLEQRY